MSELDLLIDLHVRNPRQGPGAEADTLRALDLAGIDRAAPLRVADIGCGTGASTLCLARALPLAEITAVDFLPTFLEALERNAAAEGLSERIIPLARAMEELDFEAESFDVIWSEGAAYNMGFGAAVAAWRRFLKPGGMLALSELTWLTARRPAELQAHWDAEYPEVGTASEKFAVLEQHGYTPSGYFPLPVTSWLDSYYAPLRAEFPAFLRRHGDSDAARAVVEAEQAEINLYERHRGFIGYGFYLARNA